MDKKIAELLQVMCYRNIGTSVYVKSFCNILITVFIADDTIVFSSYIARYDNGETSLLDQRSIAKEDLEIAAIQHIECEITSFNRFQPSDNLAVALTNEEMLRNVL